VSAKRGRARPEPPRFPAMGKLVPRLVRWWLPAGLAALSAIEVHEVYAGEPVLRRAATAGLLLLAALALSRRRRLPAHVAAGCAVLVLGVVLLQPDLSAQPLFSLFVVMVAAMFSLGAHADRRTFVLGAAAAAAALASLEGVQVVAGRPPSEVVPSLLFWSVAAGAGRLVHLSSLEARVERERAEQATIAERSRIARELHDVVAHSLSVMVIQASVEARTLGERDDSAARTLRAIESTGRDALVELRRLLGLLRTPGEGDGPRRPLPSLASVAEEGGMLDDVRQAGHDVTLEVRGAPRDLPAGVELSAYRVVQEALTNAVKHAPGSPVRVVVDHEHEDLRVEVRNGAGRPEAGPALDSGGHGLPGMQERVRLYDGELTAGSDGAGEWVVRARFPVAVERV
jgi:signal transduction histidine kinase